MGSIKLHGQLSLSGSRLLPSLGSTGVRRESLAFFYQVSRNICNIAQNSGQNPRHRRHQRLAHHAHEPPDSRMGRQAPRILPSASERLACDQVFRRGIPVFCRSMQSDTIGYSIAKLIPTNHSHYDCIGSTLAKMQN